MYLCIVAGSYDSVATICPNGCSCAVWPTLLGVANIKSFLDSIFESWVVFVGVHMNKWVQQRGNAPSPCY